GIGASLWDKASLQDIPEVSCKLSVLSPGQSCTRNLLSVSLYDGGAPDGLNGNSTWLDRFEFVGHRRGWVLCPAPHPTNSRTPMPTPQPERYNSRSPDRTHLRRLHHERLDPLADCLRHQALARLD